MTQKTVLSIGQCRPDQAAITHYLTSQFGAKVLTADLASDAWQVLKNQAELFATDTRQTVSPPEFGVRGG